MKIFDQLKDSFGSVAKGINSTISNLTSLEVLKEFFFFNEGGRNLGNYLKSYEENPLVYMVVNKIASTAAAMPKIAKDSNDKEIQNSKVLELLKNPNPKQSQIEFLEETNEAILLTGNVFILFESGSELGIKDSITVLKTNYVTPRFNNQGILIRYDYKDEFGRTQKYDVEDVLHIKTSNVVHNDRHNYLFGLAPLSACWVVVKSSKEKFNAEASIFKNRGIIGILTNKSDAPMLPEERERLQDEFDKESGGSDKFNKIKISTTDLNYIQTGMSPTDLKLIDSIINSLRLIASIYGMPSVLFNDTQNSTYNNYETAVTIAYTDVYLPLAEKIDAKLSKFLSEKLKVDENISTDLTKVDAVKASTHPVAQALNSLSPLLGSKAIDSMTINERRGVISLPTVEGGDVIPEKTPEPNTNVNV